MNTKTIIQVQNVERGMTLLEGNFCLSGHSDVSYPNWKSQPVSPVSLQASDKASKPVMPNWCKIMVYLLFACLYITIHSATRGHTDPEWIFLYYKIPKTK